MGDHRMDTPESPQAALEGAPVRATRTVAGRTPIGFFGRRIETA